MIALVYLGSKFIGAIGCGFVVKKTTTTILRLCGLCPGQPGWAGTPEGTFRHLLDFLEQNEDNTGRCTNNLDGLLPHPE